MHALARSRGLICGLVRPYAQPLTGRFFAVDVQFPQDHKDTKDFVILEKQFSRDTWIDALRRPDMASAASKARLYTRVMQDRFADNPVFASAWQLWPTSPETSIDILIKSIEVDSRISFQAERTVWWKHWLLLQSKKRCPKCWMSSLRCFCTALEAHSITTKHTIWVYQHYKEYMNASNTGRLLTNLCPDAHLVVFGVKEEEDAMIKEINKNLSKSFVLFPSENSITVDEFLDRHQNQDEFTKNSLQPQKSKLPDEKLQIVIIDGTWSQVKLIRRHIPFKIPFVRISPVSPSQFSLRKQTTPTRVSTIEAFSLLLKELGEPENDIQKIEMSLQLLIRELK